MSSDKSHENLFNDALERDDPVERARFLDDACGEDAALRERVDKLVRAHNEAAAFLSDPSRKPAGSDLKQTLNIAQIEKVGDRIGRYKLLQQIGEGGCGVVYMAEQKEPVRRRVALKVIMDTKQVIARFEAERQALAMMDHQNIAKVLDAGVRGPGAPGAVRTVRSPKLSYCIPIGERLSSPPMSNKADVWQGTLALMVLKTLERAGSLHGYGIARQIEEASAKLLSVNYGILYPALLKLEQEGYISSNRCRSAVPVQPF